METSDLTQANHGSGCCFQQLAVSESDALASQMAQCSAMLAAPLPAPTPTEPAPFLLIVDSDRVLAQQVAAEAAIWGLCAQTVFSLAEARAAIAQRQPDIVLLDLEFPATCETGLDLLSELVQQMPSLPILVFTAHESFVERLTVVRLGGRGFLPKPMAPAEVLEIVSHLLHQGSFEAKVLVVDDDQPLLDRLRSLLEPWGLKLTLLNTSEQFWDVLEQTLPDLLILDVEMPTISGIELCTVVRNDPRWSELPILLLSAHTDAETIRRVFGAGADDYITKPIAESELVARTLNRIERSQMLRRMADCDGLTGLSNRRKSTHDITRLLRLSERQQQPLCFMVLDIDHFKQVNDRHGHEVGDRVLTQIAEHLRKTCRTEDVVARWGGEEFVICMYGTTRSQGLDRLNNILESLRHYKFCGIGGEPFHVSFSAGVAEYPQDGHDLQSLYRAADAAMYQAKLAGRDRVLPART